jgi:cyclopropane-fatty-acyl-phospholipid synthase
MVYSCAYFHTPEEDLDTAQERKLDYICRKLRLRRGERLLDIGCGWGGLIMHAAAHYGVQAVGITLSVPQAEVARKRLHESELNNRCRVEACDYRDFEHDQQYDKIVSVGMFEHVGEALLPEYFRRAWDLLRPGGVFLNHGIAHSATYRRRGPSFIDHYVFPDSELVPINASLRVAELNGFEVRDVESLREHYALTLHQWVRRLEAHAEEVRSITDDTIYRIWRLCMAGAAHRFRSGRLNLYQTLLAKPANGPSVLPLTRDDWYQA